MYLLYNLIIIISIPFLIPFLLIKLALQKKYRTGIKERIGLIPDEISIKTKGKMVFWVHAVSVGEVTAAIPLINAIKERYPHWVIIISTVTETGNSIARERFPENDVIFFPLDIIFIVKSVIEKINPSLFIFMETEIWPNILYLLSRKNIPSILINGRISSRSFKRYNRIRPFLRKVLERITLFSMQSDRDVEHIVKLGADPEKAIRTGNIKYDQSITKDIDDPNVLRKELNIGEGIDIIIAGSTHEGEEKEILRSYSHLLKKGHKIILIIAPRHLDRIEKIIDLTRIMDIRYIRKSQINRETPSISRGDIIILDTLGELSRYYQIAAIVFVGGSLVPVGGHNILEPAASGKAVIFGPYMDNIAEISEEFKKRGCGIEVSDSSEFTQKAEELLTDKKLLKKIEGDALQLIKENQGVVLTNIELIDKTINSYRLISPDQR
ncbi:MAG: 3-deoxy-D-manno-octulosonic acid transferase [Nitrospirota bacterium]